MTGHETGTWSVLKLSRLAAAIAARTLDVGAFAPCVQGTKHVSRSCTEYLPYCGALPKARWHPAGQTWQVPQSHSPYNHHHYLRTKCVGEIRYFEFLFSPRENIQTRC